jgi:hypothetical protein
MATPTAVFRHDLNTRVTEAADRQDMLIGLKVLPAFSQPNRVGQYPKFTIAASKLLDAIATERGPTGEYGEVTRRFDLDTFNCVDRGLEERVDDTFKADFARYFDAEVVAAEQTLHNVLAAHERRAAARLMNATTFAATNSIVAYTDANVATINFAADVQGATERLATNGVVGNAIVMSDSVFNRVSRSTLFQNFVKPYNAGVSVVSRSVARNAIKEAFGLNLYIGALAYNTSKGAAASLSKVWGNTYVWVGKVMSGDPMAGGAGRTFVWNEDGGIYVTESYRDEKRRSEMVRVRQNTDEKIIDASAGTLITTQFA